MLQRLLIASLLLVSACCSYAAPRSYGSLEMGFETIIYRENTDAIFGLELSQDSVIVNPIQHSLSYTAFANDKYGFYLESTSTLFENIENEEWELGNYGVIQENDITMSSFDVKVLGAYNVGQRSQLLFGSSFFILNFNRAALTRTAGGKNFHDDIVAGEFDSFLTPAQIAEVDCDADGVGDLDEDGEKGFCPSVGTVSESQNSIELLLGYIYDTNFGLNREFSWYAHAELAFPLWHRTVNSNFEGQALSKVGGGWGLNTRAGVRWSVTKKVNVTLGVVANYKYRDTVTDNVGNRTLSVPEIDYTNLQMLAGLVWYL